MSQKKYRIKKSKIHGKGVFAKKSLKEDDIVGLGIRFNWGFFPVITPEFGSWINHSYRPNTKLVWFYSEDTGGDRNDKKSMVEEMGWYVVATKNIEKEAEILLDYANTPFYIQGPLAHYK